jgi:hypothetical protein
MEGAQKTRDDQPNGLSRGPPPLNPGQYLQDFHTSSLTMVACSGLLPERSVFKMSRSPFYYQVKFGSASTCP